jgi:hypothetical protein
LAAGQPLLREPQFWRHLGETLLSPLKSLPFVYVAVTPAPDTGGRRTSAMSRESKPPSTEKQVEDLELNKETLADLADADSEGARGGFGGDTDVNRSAGRARYTCAVGC